DPKVKFANGWIRLLEADPTKAPVIVVSIVAQQDPYGERSGDDLIPFEYLEAWASTDPAGVAKWVEGDYTRQQGMAAGIHRGFLAPDSRNHLGEDRDDHWAWVNLEAVGPWIWNWHNSESHNEIIISALYRYRAG